MLLRGFTCSSVDVLLNEIFRNDDAAAVPTSAVHWDRMAVLFAMASKFCISHGPDIASIYNQLGNSSLFALISEWFQFNNYC